MIELNSLVVVSDLHCGCRLGLCPPEGSAVDDGGRYLPSDLQRKVWAYWETFWNDFVPSVVKREPYGVVVNGDALEGVHHRATTQISQNLQDQQDVALSVLSPIAEKCKGNFWMIRGTEAHVGPSSVEEERLARGLGAIPNDVGQHARYELWKMVGPKLAHFMHHIGTTGSMNYESTAVHKELVESYTEAARWRERPPDVVVRSHRHRYLETTMAVGSDDDHAGKAISVVTPAWQLKTPFVYRVGGRLSPPQFGGIIVRWDRELFIRPKVWTIQRCEPE